MLLEKKKYQLTAVLVGTLGGERRRKKKRLKLVDDVKRTEEMPERISQEQRWRTGPAN